MINHDSWTLDSIVEAYKLDQRRVRGLREPTLKSYEQVLRPFLRFSLGEDPLDPARLTSADVVQFVTSLQDRYAARSMKHVRTALRSLFRFLRMKGYCEGKLELAIPAVAHWRMATLPRCLNEQQLEQVLEAFDPRTPCGLRDRAMVWCLATLGLRPRELAELHLEDIDWRGGTLRLRTRKTRRGAVLPLPREAGHAVVTYLRKGRPTTTERRVFVQHSGRTAIRSFMRYASVRDPASLPVAQRVLAIAGKRFDRPVLGFLSRDEMQALLDAPDLATWSGQRDEAALKRMDAPSSKPVRFKANDRLLAFLEAL